MTQALHTQSLDHAEVRCVCLHASTAAAAQWALAKVVAERHPELSVRQLYRALRKRERAGTTAIGGGMAIPHASIEGLAQAEVVLGLLDDAVNCETPDGQPVRVMALVVSDPRRPSDHLAALARVAGLLSARSADAAPPAQTSFAAAPLAASV